MSILWLGGGHLSRVGWIMLNPKIPQGPSQTTAIHAGRWTTSSPLAWIQPSNCWRWRQEANPREDSGSFRIYLFSSIDSIDSIDLNVLCGIWWWILLSSWDSTVDFLTTRSSTPARPSRWAKPCWACRICAQVGSWWNPGDPLGMLVTSVPWGRHWIPTSSNIHETRTCEYLWALSHAQLVSTCYFHLLSSPNLSRSNC